MPEVAQGRTEQRYQKKKGVKPPDHPKKCDVVYQVKTFAH